MTSRRSVSSSGAPRLTLPHAPEPGPREPVRAFVLYRDSPLRREALRAPAGDPSRYSLYGLDELAHSGIELRHDLEPEFEPGAGRMAGACSTERCDSAGGTRATSRVSSRRLAS